jgi:large subunit ribosomal protein L21
MYFCLNGSIMVESASVVAKVIAQRKASKVLVFKRKPKKGHKNRQYVTELGIIKINA